MKSILKINIVISVVILFISTGCGRFRIQDFSPSELYSINSGDKLGYPEQDGILYEIPPRLGVSGDWLIAPIPSKKQIRIFQNGELRTVISADKKDKKQPNVLDKITVTSIPLKIPGYTVAGQDDDFFTVNYIPVESPASKPAAEIQGGWYKILHYDFKGNLIEQIGRNNQTELSFENIMWMDTDNNGRLWVLYRYLGTLSLDLIEKGRVTLSVNEAECEETLFANRKIESNYTYRCEFMYPSAGGKKILMVGRVDEIQSDDKSQARHAFQYRVFKVRDWDEKNANTVFSRLNDPDDFPYLFYGDSFLFLWQNVDEHTIRLARYNLKGDLVDNFRLVLPGNRITWRSTWMKLSGDFYSIRVSDKQLNVYRWK